MVGEGLDIVDFSSIEHPEGGMQTTYKGWPLYYFKNDLKGNIADKSAKYPVGYGQRNIASKESRNKPRLLHFQLVLCII